ncbi:MAG: hypothetical protein CMB11_01125 [Euryarchaeota archaeon]|nr:hypothetical protein [Euryarchaeota archaeon]
MEVKIVEVVPHQGNLHVAGRRTFTLETGPKFRSRALGRGSSLHFCLSASRLDFRLTLNFNLRKLCLPGRFSLLRKASLFRFSCCTEAVLFLGLTLQSLFLSPAGLGFFHSASGVLFLAAGFFLTLQTGRITGALARVIGFKAAALTLNLGQLAVKFRARRGKVSTGDT